MSDRLLKLALANLKQVEGQTKESFVPMLGGQPPASSVPPEAMGAAPGGGAAPMPMDPAMMGGGMSMDPSMAAGGGMPVDPAMMGGGDPMAAGGMPGGDPLAMLQDFIVEGVRQAVPQVLQEMGISGDSKDTEAAKPKKKSVSDRLEAIENMLSQLGLSPGGDDTAAGFSAGAGEGSDAEGTMGMGDQAQSLMATGGPLGPDSAQILQGLMGSPTGEQLGTLNKRSGENTRQVLQLLSRLKTK